MPQRAHSHSCAPWHLGSWAHPVAAGSGGTPLGLPAAAGAVAWRLGRPPSPPTRMWPFAGSLILPPLPPPVPLPGLYVVSGGPQSHCYCHECEVKCRCYCGGKMGCNYLFEQIVFDCCEFFNDEVRLQGPGPWYGEQCLVDVVCYGADSVWGWGWGGLRVRPAPPCPLLKTPPTHTNSEP